MNRDLLTWLYRAALLGLLAAIFVVLLAIRRELHIAVYILGDIEHCLSYPDSCD